ncbi:hypothetical protein BDA96_02G109200 [Sorghum bicolor]|uniref:Uncharacterized protein n=1 Tax=Sorghum bicolor TaxID=4558 RepID=A0A921RN40_SORBI|nr:hypothetical protein BDA96_02G109200 [Sorghum bicolor]
MALKCQTHLYAYKPNRRRPEDMLTRTHRALAAGNTAAAASTPAASRASWPSSAVRASGPGRACPWPSRAGRHCHAPGRELATWPPRAVAVGEPLGRSGRPTPPTEAAPWPGHLEPWPQRAPALGRMSPAAGLAAPWQLEAMAGCRACLLAGPKLGHASPRAWPHEPLPRPSRELQTWPRELLARPLRERLARPCEAPGLAGACAPGRPSAQRLHSLSGRFSGVRDKEERDGERIRMGG